MEEETLACRDPLQNPHHREYVILHLKELSGKKINIERWKTMKISKTSEELCTYFGYCWVVGCRRHRIPLRDSWGLPWCRHRRV